MKKEEKKLVNSVSSAENGIDIDAEKNAESSGPQSGESESSAAGSEKEKTAEFEALISGRYKKQFAARVQKIIDRRLKEVKRQRENSQTNERIVEALMNRFGIRDGNIEKLERVITTETMQNTNGALALIIRYFNQFGLAVLVAVAGFVMWRLRSIRRRKIHDKYNPNDKREIK